jgi:hypothetical protein
MSEEPEETVKISIAEIVLEALKKIRSEILAYAVAVAALLIASASLGLDVLRELKWPLVAVFTVALAAYFLARALPQARIELRRRRAAAAPPEASRAPAQAAASQTVSSDPAAPADRSAERK